MRVVTWNVNSIGVRLPRVLELLDKHAPDVVLLQEIKCTDEAFPDAELAAAGYASAAHGAGRWAGVAILARADGPAIEDVGRGLPGAPAAEEARWMEATIGGVRLASVYVINGRALDSPHFADKLDFLDAMADRAAALRDAGSTVVIGGDMNVCPTDIDVYDPAAFADSTHVTPQERGALADVMGRGALVDAYRRLHPDEQQFTWWDYRQGHFHRGMGLRIDLLMMSETLAERLAACGIDRDLRKGPKPSDHAPLLADIDHPTG